MASAGSSGGFFLGLVIRGAGAAIDWLQPHTAAALRFAFESYTRPRARRNNRRGSKRRQPGADSRSNLCDHFAALYAAITLSHLYRCLAGHQRFGHAKIV